MRRAAPEALLAKSPSETVGLLLALAEAQAGRRGPAELLRQQDRDLYVAPCPVDLRLLHRLDGLALAAAEGFEAVALSPVAPLGSCSALGLSHQDRTLSANRGLELVSDPTNVLALLCAQRLRAAPRQVVRLCTLHQTLRCQPLPPVKGYTRHFRLFALAEAGRARGEHAFEVEAIVRHVAVWDRLFDAAEGEGFRFPERRALVFRSPAEPALGARVWEALGQALPHVARVEETLESDYYDGIRVLFGARAADGGFKPIGDTGRFDWVARLSSNARQRYIASGLGLQLVPLLFRDPS